MHHIVSDGWSMGIFSREITALYEAYASGKENPLTPLEIQYADYAHWQRSTLAEEGLGEQLSYWQDQLSDAPDLLTLPWDRARPAQQDYRGGYVGIHLGEELTEQLNTLAKSKGMTLYMVLLCAWGMLLSRLSGQETVVIATPVANRGRLELKDQIGFFVNILAIRIDIDPAKSLAAYLDEVREQTLNAYAHQDVPFDMVVEKIQPARSLSYGPVCQADFTFENGLYEDDVDLVDIALSDVALLDGTAHPNVQSQYDIALMLRELNSGEDAVIQGEVVYASALFDEQTIEKWTEYLVRLLKGLVQEHRQAESVGLVPILSDAEQEVLVYRFNGTEAYYPKDKCIHELFEEQVAQNPHAIALVSEDKALSYDQLNKKANQFAHELVGLGVQPDSLVGFCLDRSAEAIVGLLGILKAGGAYLPLDPSYPEDRLRYMIEDSGISTLVTQLDLFVDLPVSDQQIICVDLEDAVSDQPTTNIPPENRRLSSSNLAYVMYTSGTTGRPKGTLIEHRAVVSLVVNNTYVPLTTTTRFLQGAALSFDAATLEVWGPLLNGGQLAIFSNRYVSSKELGDFMSTRAVNTAWLTSGLFDQFVSTYREPLPNLRHLLVGGDVVNSSSVSSMKGGNPDVTMINGYGPTENTTFTACYVVPKGWEEGDKLPIGSPISARKVFILDESEMLCAIGVVGELYVGGAGIAREYLNLPELTAERFITNPFSEDPAERLYKTGDLGRWNKEGTIEFYGRNDSQVKIRGFRIELSEVESWLREQTGIDDVLVVVYGEGNAKQLVGYVTAEVEGDLQLGVIHSAIRVSLPEYMIPSELILLESFPLTANGKIDRKALPEPDGSGLSRPEYEAPEGETEQALATIWRDLLQVEQVGRGDNYFDLGGHSLLAVQLVSRIEQGLSRTLSLKSLFDHPVLSDLAAQLQSSEKQGYIAIERVDRDQPLPLSWSQQRLWFIAQLDEQASLAYHIPVSVRLTGELNQEALNQTLSTLLERHEVLRTTFVQNEAGEPIQVIHPETSFALSRVDLSGVNRKEQGQRIADLEQVESETAFDLENGPLIRGRLIDLGVNNEKEPEFVLLATMHHIVSDGWSMGIFSREITALYAAYSSGKENPLTPLEIQYADYAHWQRSTLAEEGLGEQLSYWQGQLSDAPELLTLPWDRARPARQDYRGGRVDIQLGEELTEQLKALAQSKGMTLYMVLLSAWGMLLSRLSGQETVVVGTPVANRPRAELEGLIGFFVNTLAIRLDVDTQSTLSGYLEQVREQTLNGYGHQDAPFEQVVDVIQPGRSLSHSALFQAMFAFQTMPNEGEFELTEVMLSSVGSAPRSDQGNEQNKFDINLTLEEIATDQGRVIVGGLAYASALFDKATIERWSEYLVRLLTGLVEEHSQVELVGQLPMISAAEREQVLYEFNATELTYPKDKCIHELFEEQVAHNPVAIALVHGEAQLTYEELNHKSNKLAHYLLSQGVKPDALIGLCVQRSVEMVVGMLGILKAGGAYVPIDPAYPQQRLVYILDDAGIELLLTQESLKDGLPLKDQQVVCLDKEEFADQSNRNLVADSLGLAPDSMAYVIYTSGTTGNPKGVLIEHHNLVNYSYCALEHYYKDVAGALFNGSFCFDGAISNIYLPLISGGKVVMISEINTHDGVIDCLDEESYLVKITASQAELLIAQSRDKNHISHTFVIGGERFPVELYRKVQDKFPVSSIYNHYGPTEATIGCSLYEIDPQSLGEELPIGSPMGNTQMYILDSHAEPSGIGVSGEIFIGGEGVARGYLNRSELTASSFIHDRFSENPDARLYRTGDMGYWNEDGTIALLGRNDEQIKIRGYRVEPGEIESKLREHEQVEDALVVSFGEDNDQRLVGYVIAATEDDKQGQAESLKPEEVREQLKALLPEYMVPSELMVLEAFPMTPNGKLDRKALPEPDGRGLSRGEYEAPIGDTEQALAEIWQELLRVDQVGRWDNFFDLGGHSLLAVQLVARIERGVSRTLSLRDLFDCPVLSEMADVLESSTEHKYITIERTNRDTPLPLSWSQQRLWFIAQLDEQASLAYHMPVSVRLNRRAESGSTGSNSEHTA